MRSNFQLLNNKNYLKYRIDTAINGVDDQNDDEESLLVVVSVQADHDLDEDEAENHDQGGSQEAGSEVNFVTKHRAGQYKYRQGDVAWN